MDGFQRSSRPGALARGWQGIALPWSGWGTDGRRAQWRSVFQPNPPQLLFKLPPEFLRLSSNPGALADVSRDNQKILLSIPAQEGARQALSVVLNWQAGLAK